MNQSVNPLKQYFRQPGIYLRLPSGGEFWPENTINMPDNQELPVLPMTAIDEITYRTPDALFNGQAVVNVIQSCIPDIKDAWDCPSTDINPILIAIRIASYGHNMGIETACPACENIEEYELDLRSVLDQVKTPRFDKSVSRGDLEITFRPMSYRDQNTTNQQQFEQQRMLQQLPGADLPDNEKLERLNSALSRITELTIEALKWSIASIRTPQAIVTDHAHIHEFLTNCDRNLFAQIRDQVIELRQASELKPIPIKCSECGHEHQQTLNLDAASFFAAAS
jgi:hypothetical protein